ncbi:MAG: nitroreductase family deazaflavin-dependent oxidoreductase [Leptolinea sp.]|jgi:deazaflavin-dependent oxidoreductase (nitroreductase family)|nr:nitroreductase family deazaflavin-dependent oxidoreductase [Leptolinea sp.]
MMFPFRFFRALNKRIVENYRRGIGPVNITLLLTTTGRKSGLPRITPVQYEEVDGLIYVGSARGQKSDWFKNILADPRVHVQIQKREFDAIAEAVTDTRRMADFIQLRVQRHPIMLRLIMFLADGLPFNFDRAQLEKYCENRAMVILRPVESQEESPA